MAETAITLYPLNPLPFHITASDWNRTLRRMTLTWNSQPGVTYRVELSGNLASWTPLASGIAATGNSTVWTSATLPLASRHFFRVVAE